MTTTALLDALHEDVNDAAWREIDARFRPIVFAVACRLGLDEEAAAEVAQQTLAEFVRDYRRGCYERGRGRLHHWIVGIAKHRTLDALRERQRRRRWRGASAFDSVGTEPEMMQFWEVESERAIFQQALATLRETSQAEPRTLHAFERVTLGNATPRQVAEEFGLDAAEVYRIKNRMTKRLREIVEQLTKSWEAVA